MQADILTKPLCRIKHEQFVKHLNLVLAELMMPCIRRLCMDFFLDRIFCSWVIDIISRTDEFLISSLVEVDFIHVYYFIFSFVTHI